MADHNIDILLRAKDQASKAIHNVNSELSKTSKAGSGAGRVLKGVGVGLAAGAGIIAGGIAVAVHSGLQDLATLESAVTSVDGAISQVGLTGQVTGAQIAGWANDIERDIGAAFDDKDITKATANLIRFGKVTPQNLKPAMVVMTDLAAKTGSVESASTLLGKALADPTKAAGKLARQGIILTKAEQKQIDAFVKAGKIGDAQSVILDKIAKSTKGAAAATQGPYQRSLSVLADVSEDARKALAIGFLPVLQKLSDKLSTALADPAVLSNIEDFGKGIAGGLDDLIDFGEKVPWGAIGTGLKTAAEWTGKLFDAFRSIPPEAQATIVALAGLNKLSGGAVSGVIGELGKGLIKGVLGMNAGVVNIKAGVVNGGGGVGGGGSVGGGGASKAAKALGALAIVGEIAGVVATQQEVSAQNSAIASDIHTSLSQGIKTKAPAELITALNGVNQGINDIQANPLNVLVSGSALDELRGMRADLSKQLNNAGTGANFATHGGDKWKADSEVTKRLDAVKVSADGTSEAVNMARDRTVASQNQTKSSVVSATNVAAGRTSNAATGAGSRVTTQSIGNTSRITGAIAANRPIVNTNVQVYVTAGHVTKSQTTSTRTGGGSSSSSDDSYSGHGK